MSTHQHDQNFFQLASIICAPLALPVVIIGAQLAEKFGAGTAISSIIVGNLILWLIGIAMASMPEKERLNAIENIKNYLGNPGKIAVALVFIFAFLNWYVIEINSATISLNSMLHFNNSGFFLNLKVVGVIFGLLSALLSIGGILWIKRLAFASMPFVILYHFYVILISDISIFPIESFELSLIGVISSVLAILPGIVNLPTVFRHSRSKEDSYLALTFIVLFTSFFEISTIWMKFSGYSEFDLNTWYFIIPTSAFILLTLINSNLLNIYFASACWEAFVPKIGRAKGYAIIGLLGTLAYAFIEKPSFSLFFEDLANSYIATVGVVLLMAFLVRKIVKHRPRTFERTINGISWFLGSLAATILKIQYPDQQIQSLVGSIATSVLVFLCVIFVEEMIWSIQKVSMTKKAS
ncbi:MAG: hypothetical protein KGJ02_06885 [Verrucomicrobiota bacterium]|nr:hypothetical protein [Verrucomicrobiota bacterium]